MNRENSIIGLYLKIDGACREILGENKLRRCGRNPNLTDAEVLTIEIFGQMQGQQTDAAIWRYIDAHWRGWFPKLSSYKAFAKQIANLTMLKHLVFRHLFPPKNDIHITDGVPMPICHLARATRAKVFCGEASYGFCAAKDEHYYGFKGHVLIDMEQQVVGFSLTPANVDERNVLDNFKGKLFGMLIGDKGLLSKPKKADLLSHGIDLQTPLRDNMHDSRPKSEVRKLMKVRRRVETVIGQLTEFFGLSSCKAKDMWHLTAKLLRKILAYNFTKC
jgi:hypothetical protein